LLNAPRNGVMRKSSAMQKMTYFNIV